MLSRILCLLCGLLLSIGVQASTESIQVESAYVYAEQSRSLPMVQSLDESNWHHVTAFGSHGFLSGEFWLRTRLHNEGDAAQTVVLRFTYPFATIAISVRHDLIRKNRLHHGTGK